MGQKISSQGASLFGFDAALPILDIDPLDLQIGVLPEKPVNSR
jgi:hypothetical protein